MHILLAESVLLTGGAAQDSTVDIFTKPHSDDRHSLSREELTGGITCNQENI